jgi:hypothetical protein
MYISICRSCALSLLYKDSQACIVLHMCVFPPSSLDRASAFCQSETACDYSTANMTRKQRSKKDTKVRKGKKKTEGGSCCGRCMAPSSIDPVPNLKAQSIEQRIVWLHQGSPGLGVFFFLFLSIFFIESHGLSWPLLGVDPSRIRQIKRERERERRDKTLDTARYKQFSILVGIWKGGDPLFVLEASPTSKPAQAQA